MPITHYQRKTYPIAPSDATPRKLPRIKDVAGLEPGRVRQYQHDEPGHRLEIRAIYTGEKRAPRAGEWYLSGSIIEAWYAPSDLSTAYHIARLVVVRVRTVETFELVKEGQL